MQDCDESDAMKPMADDEADMTEEEFDARWEAGQPAELAREAPFRISGTTIESGTHGVRLTTMHLTFSRGQVAATGITR